MSRSVVRRRAIVTAALGAALACAAPGVASAQDLDVVADGLANPRGMDFGPDGHLYVAEAGRGGAGPPCIAFAEGGDQCYGATGAITRVNLRSGRTRQVLAGLASVAPQEPGEDGAPAGSNATGPQDVSFNWHAGYFTVGLGGGADEREQLGAVGDQFGSLYRVGLKRRNWWGRGHGHGYGRVQRVADLAAYEFANDPDKDTAPPAQPGEPPREPDSNPYSVDAGNPWDILVTDAGGNDLLGVSPWGRIRTLAIFPFGTAPAPPFLGLPPGTEIPYEAVPTGVARGRDDAAYVGQLTGFPFPPGKANVYRVRSGPPSVAVGGFTTVVDVGLGRDGSLYVLQISSTGLLPPPSAGKLIRVERDGKRTELSDDLQQPTGLAVSRSGDVYVANNGGSPDGGQIVRIRG